MRAARLGPPAGEEASEAVLELTVHLGLGTKDDLSLRNDDQVKAGLALVSAAPEAFPEEALRPIARHRRPHPPADRESQPVMPQVVRRGQELVEGPVEALALAKDAPELARGLEPLTRREARSRAQAESRFRPFWRRRFKTSRPPLVRMRTRKPWVRFRLRLLGWNVLFISSSLDRRFVSGAVLGVLPGPASGTNHEG
jgi:hypothetical protein